MSPTAIRAALGRTWRTARARKRGCAIVLTYHRVGDTTGDTHHLAISPTHFAEQILTIAREHEVLTAGDLASLMRSGERLPQRAVVVTFDDGYAETHEIAGQILADCGVRATSFLCSDTIGMPGEYEWDAEGGPATARISRRVLTADEIRLHHAGGVFEFGAHTRTHPQLSRLDESSQRDEIVSGKAALDTLLGGPCRTFAYPHGGSGDFDATSVALVREAGFDAAFTTAPGIVVPQADRFAVPRYHTEDIDGDAFRTLLNRWFDAAR